MRDNWQMNTNNSSSESVNSPKNGNVSMDAKRLYDFSRPISAPPRAEFGLDILGLDDDLSLTAWSNHLDGANPKTQGLSYDFPQSNEGGTSYGYTTSPARSQSAAPKFSELNKKPEEDVNYLFNSFNSMKIGSSLNRPASTGIIGHGTNMYKDGNPLPSSSSLGLTANHEGRKSSLDLIQEDISNHPSHDYGSNQTSLGLSLSRHSSGNLGSQNSLTDSVHHHDHYSMGRSSSGHSHNDFFGRSQMSQTQNRIGNQISHGQIPSYESANSLRSMSYQDASSAQGFSTDHPIMLDRQRGYDSGSQTSLFYDYNVRNSASVQPTSSHGMNQPPNNTVYSNGHYGPHVTPQYHQSHHSQVPFQQGVSGMIHTHDSNAQGRITQQQYIMPMQGGYQLHQMQPIQSGLTQSFTVLDSSGRPATVSLPVVSSSIPDVNRKSVHASNPRNSDKMNRRQPRGIASSKKNSSGSSLDTSKHSLSSATIQLLDEYRSSKSRNWTAHDVRGHISEFCQDQNGSRFIQQRLEVADTAEKEVILTEVLSSIERLRNDVFGNYVVQKLFDHGTDSMRVKLKLSMVGEVEQLSRHMYGCRVVQKALETLKESDFVDIISEFHENVFSCIHDQNGNHVIQKVVEVISSRAKTYQLDSSEKAAKCSSQLNFVLDCVMKNTVSLSCHPYGCRVLQRILEHCVESQKSATLNSIQKCLRTLLDDQYGNYVIQHVLQYGRKTDRDIVLQMIIENNLLVLSKQKFASNVIEKLLKYGSAEHRTAIVREMLKPTDDETVESGRSSVVLLMVRDAYANYVVQTTLDVAPEGEDKSMLYQELKNHSAQLRNYTFAKHIITKLEESGSRRFAS